MRDAGQTLGGRVRDKQNIRHTRTEKGKQKARAKLDVSGSTETPWEPISVPSKSGVIQCLDSAPP